MKGQAGGAAEALDDDDNLVCSSITGPTSVEIGQCHQLASPHIGDK
jgi:hypothetical protein